MAAMETAVGWATVTVSEVSGRIGVGGGEGGIAAVKLIVKFVEPS